MMIKGKRTKRPHPSATLITTTHEEDQNMAHCLILLAQGGPSKTLKRDEPPTSLYDCKTCNRTFHSFQALGGHRASHNKPRSEKPSPPPFLEIACGYNSSSTWSASNIKPKVHECAICAAEFSSGQALGGHMRRHRPLASSVAASPPQQPSTPPRSQMCLDLNLPADEQDELLQQSLVFSASLIDCPY